jgi:hypothetical protein
VAGERRLAPDQIVEDRAQRIDVGVLVDGRTNGLLRRHERECSQHPASLAQHGGIPELGPSRRFTSMMNDGARAKSILIKAVRSSQPVVARPFTI